MIASLGGPSLHDAGLWPVQLFGLIQDKGVTTLATPRPQTTSAGSVYHARLERDSLIEMRGSRYKAGIGWSEVELSTK